MTNENTSNNYGYSDNSIHNFITLGILIYIVKMVMMTLAIITLAVALISCKNRQTMKKNIFKKQQ